VAHVLCSAIDLGTFSFSSEKTSPMLPSFLRRASQNLVVFSSALVNQKCSFASETTLP